MKDAREVASKLCPILCLTCRCIPIEKLSGGAFDKVEGAVKAPARVLTARPSKS